MKTTKQSKNEKFASSLIGLTAEEAYDKIMKAKLQSNLVKDKKTGIVSASNKIRVMILMPDYITVSLDRDDRVSETRVG